MVAPLLAFAMFYLTRDISPWTATVLDIVELQHIQERGWELAYKTDQDMIEIFGTKAVQNADKIILELIYNPERLVVTLSDLPSHASLVSHERGSLELILQDLQQLKLEEWWLVIPFVGDPRDILLAKAETVVDWNATKLRIWNLSVLKPWDDAVE